MNANRISYALIAAIALLIAHAVFVRIQRLRSESADVGDTLSASDTFVAARALPVTGRSSALDACAQQVDCVAARAEQGDRGARLALRALLARTPGQAQTRLRTHALRYLESERDAGNIAALFELSAYWGDGVLAPRDIYRQYVYLYADAQVAPPVVYSRTYAALQRMGGELSAAERDNAEREGSALFARCCARAARRERN